MLKTKEMTSLKKQNGIELLTDEMCKKYSILIDGSRLYIHEPAFISIDKFVIIDGETTLTIRNKKMVVDIWKDVVNMSITVF